MFTGIITAVQRIERIGQSGSNAIFTIHKPIEWELQIGESIAINGVCSTVIRVDDATFDVEYMPETLRLTTMRDRRDGEVVNLERSMRPTDLLSGYIVSGHVEAMGVITAIEQDGDSHRIQIEIPDEHRQYILHKGGITIDGIALTVIEPEENRFWIAVIPHTWQKTNIQQWNVGDAVNLEYDQIAKYVERFLQLREEVQK